MKSVLNSTFTGILLPFLAIIYSHNHEIVSIKTFLPYAVRLLELFHGLNENWHKNEGSNEGKNEGENVKEKRGGGGKRDGRKGGETEDDIKEDKRESIMQDEIDCSDNSEGMTPVWSHVVLIDWLEDQFKWVGE